jgi:hypothetical protein
MVRDHYLTFDSFPTPIVSRFHLPLRNEISAGYALMVSKLSWGFYPVDGYSCRKVAGFFVQYVSNKL